MKSPFRSAISSAAERRRCAPDLPLAEVLYEMSKELRDLARAVAAGSIGAPELMIEVARVRLARGSATKPHLRKAR
jgi:hypothetical protein